MIEIEPNLFVGGEADERQTRNQPGWFFIHACKEPYHRQALGYTGRAASNQHPEYLIARREGRIILNLVDVDKVDYIAPQIVDAALEAIDTNLPTQNILLHCNLGQSRSPTIALLYLASRTDRFKDMDAGNAIQAFRIAYPMYNPAKGMADYLQLNWARYNRT